MKKFVLFLFFVFFIQLPVWAEETTSETEGKATTSNVKWGALAAAFAIGLVGFAGALGQGKAISSACEGLARNPGAGGAIRTSLLLGLAFIESIVIYALLIAFLTYKL